MPFRAVILLFFVVLALGVALMFFAVEKNKDDSGPSDTESGAQVVQTMRAAAV